MAKDLNNKDRQLLENFIADGRAWVKAAKGESKTWRECGGELMHLCGVWEGRLSSAQQRVTIFNKMAALLDRLKPIAEMLEDLDVNLGHYVTPITEEGRALFSTKVWQVSKIVGEAEELRGGFIEEDPTTNKNLGKGDCLAVDDYEKFQEMQEEYKSKKLGKLSRKDAFDQLKRSGYFKGRDISDWGSFDKSVRRGEILQSKRKNYAALKQEALARSKSIIRDKDK